ncbi:50S ribosomal protein L4 [Pigmentibacter ruber]|uniref:50S ribosomal protein L4 n=1 Tax=Pigmentibacter TaxID=2838409 RepID=UPI00131AA45D|nr:MULTISPECIES: 50S ribosomal protein L4 [Pigmentibacter]WGL60736.1 50S ribosomal protein L4 [Pigmentibacter sp. JX0631]BFD31320.1 50S ribosomal protein L4 [Pigmentibacter ruber]
MLSKIEALPESLVSYADRNKGTLWQVIKAYRANQRQGTVGVKTRAMVKSTGKKPYKQKKTGSARRGSFVAPLHVGGGVAHGPKARDYRQAIPTKMSKVALGIALSERVKSGKIFVGALDFPSGKTKDAASALKNVADLSGNTLVCLSNPNENTIRALRNIRGVHLVSPDQVNAFTVLQARSLIASPEAFKVLESRLAD